MASQKLFNIALGSSLCKWRHMNAARYFRQGTLTESVHVISRIKGLAAELTRYVKEKKYDISIMDVPLPENTDVIPSRDICNTVVAVIDPKVLALNFKSMPFINWAYCTWAGVEPLFEVMTEKPSFLVTRHSGADFSDQMGQFILGQVLSYEGNFKQFWEGQREKSWSNMLSKRHETRRLKDLSIGILGVGNMGQAVAKYLKPHGSKLFGLSRKPRNSDEFGYFDRITICIIHILQSSDYIINTLPSTRDTKGLLNNYSFSICKKKPVFINVGRANIIDEEELIYALKEKWISDAIIDVFEQEPLPPDNKLWDKVTVTPHVAAFSQPNFIAKDFLEALKEYKGNKPVRKEVNWDVGY